MFITYQGTQTALTFDVQGKAIRLAPSQPVKITAAQLDILKERKITQIMLDKGVITIDEPKAKAAPKDEPKAESKTAKKK